MELEVALSVRALELEPVVVSARREDSRRGRRALNQFYRRYDWGQKTGFGERYYSVDFSETDHAAVGRAFGIQSWRVTEPGALEGALREALSCGAPALVDVVCQPLQEARAPVSEWIA